MEETGAPSPDGGSEASASSLDVPTDKGMVHGSASGGVRSFLGIPFAATTAGPNRWKPPQPAAPWTTTLKATALDPICPQVDPATMKYATTGDENCLSLNVWTPNPAPTTPLPVMVWIYGGAFIFGSSGAAPYSGNHLVPKGVVVVSMNYRVGALGFLAHSGLAAEDPNHVAGNYGLLDQQAALNWVQTNIGEFGGDKTKVTLFGESAGGKSTNFHLLSPGSRGLFSGAIVESGYYSLPGLTLAQAESQGDRYAQAMGCTDAATALSCLRAKSPMDIVAGPATTPAQLPGGTFYQDDTTSLTFQPIVDGKFLPDEPATMFASGKQAPVPVLLGANGDEGVLFQYAALGPYTPVVTNEDYVGALTRRFGAANAAMIAAHYPTNAAATGPDGGVPSDAGGVPDAGGDGGGGLPAPNDALIQVSGDAFFACPARQQAKLLAAGTSKTFLYRFKGVLNGPPFPFLMNASFHSAELPYVFGDSYALGSVPPANQPLVDAIEGYWTQFAKTGDPNGGSNPMWPAYTTAADQNLTLDTTIAVSTGLEKANCDFWENIPL
jgi:para-nitrobenzyl esterase